MPLGVGLATAPVRSQYWITESDPAFPRRHPVVVLPDANAYTRPELGGLVIGLRERRSVSVDPRALPADTTGFAFDDDPHGWNALAEGSDRLQRFLPALEHVGIRHHIAGFSTYTPDGRPILGPVDGVDGLLVASGCCGAGIAISGGVGFVLAELACGRRPSIDLAPFRNDRFGAVDPYDPAFRQRCAAARSNKSAG
jgi:4-methylaminobutanoate oxidase (formaldehyde-forming)